MDSVLIAAGSEKAREALSHLSKLCGLTTQAFAECGNDARRLLLENDYGLVLINTPLPDEFGSDLAVAVCEGFGSAILLVKADIADEISEKVECSGVLVIEKPINRQMFFQSIRMAGVQQSRMNGLQRENKKLKDKIEEIRTVDRAKCLLIQFESMTEMEAHRYIEKQAMDHRVSRMRIAQDILCEYEKT